MIFSKSANLSLEFKKKCAFSLFTLLISCNCYAANAWNISLDDSNGLPKLSKGGGEVMTSSFLFFDKNWDWAEQESNFKVSKPGQYLINGTNKTLGFTLKANISKVSNQKMIWNFDLDSKSGKKDIIGGGISFKFDRESLGQSMGEPQILTDKSGWAWGKGANRTELRFNPKPADIFFENTSKEELRVFFYSGSIPAKKLTYQATLSLTGDILIKPTISERFGGENKSDWTENIIDWKVSPVDLSFLNTPERPAGKRGFIKAKGEKLVFEDGTVAKFWGTNISAYTLFGTPKENVKSQAKRLSELGFNLVRIHHFDSLWVDPNIFGASNLNSSKTINAESLDKIDWWVKCLKDEGIYVFLDLHVERHLKPTDGITAFDEISEGKPEANLKGFNYVNLSIQQAMRAFNAAYVSHINKYTKLRYADDPAITTMLITNENDVTHHFGNVMLYEKKVPHHNKLYMDAANNFAKKHHLSEENTWHAWEHGPSKLFLNDLEHKFNVEMMNHLHKLGVKVPLVTTSSWGDDPLCALPALTSGDMIDVHYYQTYGVLEANPLFSANILHWISAAQVVGMPLSVTEWNADQLSIPDRHTLPLYIASHASHQGWDSMMQFAYASSPLVEPNEWGEGKPSRFILFNDPAMLATMPAAALMYRRGDVQEAKTNYVLDLGQAIFNKKTSPADSVYIRTASELGKLTIAMPNTKELSWLKKSSIPSGAKVSSDPNVSLLSANATEVTSDTKELKRNWDKGYSTINTPKTQAASGWIGGEALLLNDVSITATTRNASIAVQSLDDVPINRSKNIFISLAARAVPKAEEKLPFFSEPVEGQLMIKAAKGLKLYKLIGGHHKKELSTSYKNGIYTINLDKTLSTYWLSLSK